MTMAYNSLVAKQPKPKWKNLDPSHLHFENLLYSVSH
jgi:hypothetical protein